MPRPKSNLEQNLAGKVRSRELLSGELDPKEKDIRALLKKKLAYFPGVIGFTIVGSRALGYALPESDFDVLALTDRKFTEADPALDMENLERDAKKFLKSAAERLLGRTIMPGPYPIQIGDKKIEIWFRNVNTEYLNYQMKQKKYTEIGCSYQALFNPATPQNGIIKKLRAKVASQFQLTFQANHVGAKNALIEISKSIAGIETISMLNSVELDGTLLREISSKFHARTGLSGKAASEILDSRAELWYRHLSKYLLVQPQSHA